MQHRYCAGIFNFTSTFDDALIIILCGSRLKYVRIRAIKSVLGRVRNCVDEQALHCEMAVSSYVCQPNHSYAESMFRLHSDHTRGCVVAGVLPIHSVCMTRTTPPRDYPTVLFIGLWPHSFHKIMYLYSICLVSTICAVTPPSHSISSILTYILFLMHSWCHDMTPC